ncbi:MAG: hypothetical protein ACTSPY_04115 [Candidatus Helarchaeota archaeon]
MEDKIIRIKKMLFEKGNIIKESEIKKEIKNINDSEIKKIITEIWKQFKSIGLELFIFEEEDEKYYMILIPDSKPNISFENLGILAISFSIIKAKGGRIEADEFERIFKLVLENVKILVRRKYLVKFEKEGVFYYKMGPFGIGILKNGLETIPNFINEYAEKY